MNIKYNYLYELRKILQDCAFNLNGISCRSSAKGIEVAFSNSLNKLRKIREC